MPLGDVVERRKLMLRLFAAVSLALVAAGLAPSFWVLVAASVAIGMTASVTHILVPHRAGTGSTPARAGAPSAR